MGLLDGFEKLINEHGSATILKERIALANDKYSALEKEFAASLLRAETAEARVTDLAAENQGLKLDNEKLRQEIQRRYDESKNEISHRHELRGQPLTRDIFINSMRYQRQLSHVKGRPLMHSRTWK
jgi:regulator of replication initiation timing